MNLENRVVGIDPGIHNGHAEATCCEILWPDVVSHPHISDFNKVVKLCKEAAIVIVETPDPSFGIKPYATQALAKVSNISGMLWGMLQTIEGQALSVPAEVIREYTCSYKSQMRCKADPFIKNWLENFHFPHERRQPRPDLFKPKGQLSTTHKRDAYLAALLGEMMLKNKLLRSRVEARST